MTRTLPWRRITLQEPQMRRTEARTFIFFLSCIWFGLAATTVAASTFPSVHDAAASEIVGRQFDGNCVPRGDADVVHPHLAGDVCQDLLAVFKLNVEGGVREGFPDYRGQLDGLFLGHV